MFAIVKTGGKQFKVRVGETIDVEKLDVDEGIEIQLDQVLLAANDGDVAFGQPVIDGAVVTAQVARQHKGPKLIVFKYKSKSRYRRRTGHRQKLTQLTIQSIAVPGWEVARVEVAAPAESDVVEVAAPVATAVAEASPQAPLETAETTPVAQGSAAPANDVISPLDPAAQVEAVDSGAEPTGGAPVVEPPLE